MSAGSSHGHARETVRDLLRLPRPGARWSPTRYVVAGVLGVGIAPVAKRFGRLWTWILIATAIGFALGLLPLFGVLGYELAEAMTIIAAIMGLDVGSAIARALQRETLQPRPDRAEYAGLGTLRGAIVAAAVPVAIICIPAVISAVRGIWLPTCDWTFGIKAYALLPVVTAALAGAMGFAVGALVPAQPRGVRWLLAGAAPFVPALVVAAAALWRFYAAPPVFTYNAILGYFPGNLYDENVELNAALWWSRLAEFLWVVGVLALVSRWLDVPSYRVRLHARPHHRGYGLWIGVAALVAAVGIRSQGGALGYKPDAEDIEEALGGRFETPHFIIHYAKTKEIEETIGLIAEDHEFRLSQVVAELGIAPSQKLRSFYFADSDQKARWMGARDVQMAKPWRREIYLEHRGFPHSSLRHEIAHAVAAEFCDPVFGVAVRRVFGLPLLASPGLIEGLAVATDWPGGYERFTPHESVRVLQELGARPEIRSLLSLQFFSVSSSASYTTAGSFLRYLLDTYGAVKLRALYHSGGDFDGVYHRDLGALENDWRAMLDTIALPPGAAEMSKERFRVGSVFQRPCPHAIAAKEQLADEAMSHGKRDRAIALLRDVCVDAPEEPRYRLNLADKLAGGSDLEEAEALGYWTQLAGDTNHVTSTLRAEAFERLARYTARSHPDQLARWLELGTKLPLSDVERRQLDAMSFALHYTGAAGPRLRGYFFNASPVIPAPVWAQFAILAEPTAGFPHYLLGLQKLTQGELVAASAELEKALALGLPGPAFVKNGARRLAVAAYRMGNGARVRSAIASLRSPALTTGDHLLADDWERRLAFDARPRDYTQGLVSWFTSPK
ncbi:hypothetical protein BH11MYX2_BH11MYX2_29590 [soil metagenome]